MGCAISTPAREQPPLPHGEPFHHSAGQLASGRVHQQRVEGKRDGEALFPWLLALPLRVVAAEVATVAGEREHLGFGPDILALGAANSAALPTRSNNLSQLLTSR